MRENLFIAVDFDGTIVEHAYPEMGRPVPYALEALKLLQQNARSLLILWTVREGELLDRAVEYCAANGLEFYAVNQNYPGEEECGGCPRKLSADIFIDDRNLGGLPDWRTIYEMLTGEKWPDGGAGRLGEYYHARRPSWWRRLIQ